MPPVLIPATTRSENHPNASLFEPLAPPFSMYSTPNTGMEINDLGSPIIALMKIYQTIYKSDKIIILNLNNVK